jgi:hypothetical protein
MFIIFAKVFCFENSSCVKKLDHKNYVSINSTTNEQSILSSFKFTVIIRLFWNSLNLNIQI